MRVKYPVDSGLKLDAEDCARAVLPYICLEPSAQLISERRCDPHAQALALCRVEPFSKPGALVSNPQHGPTVRGPEPDLDRCAFR